MSNWLRQDNVFSPMSGDFGSADILPVGVYNLNLTMTGWHLSKYAERFVFPYKVYGLQTKFVNYILKTYENTNQSLGILLNGTKGTGKTVTAKVIANKLELPVIIIKDLGDSNQAMVEFISNIKCDCVLFFDEFEKNFREQDSTILQLMDGVYTSNYRRVFLLTTNNKTINDNMLGRPSRIRYVKEFGNLELEVVEEYLDDALVDKSKKQDVINFVDELEISTIDILKSVVNEINIHGFEEFKASKEFFNVKYATNWYNCDFGYINIEDFEKLKEKNPNIDIIEEYLTAAIKRSEDFPVELYSKDTREEKAIYNKAYREWCDNHRTKFYFDHEYFKWDIKFKNLKIGDHFYTDSITVVKIDRNRNIIVATDGFRLYVFVITKNTSSSIYNPIAYAYIDL